jgi:hypothetical protein
MKAALPPDDTEPDEPTPACPEAASAFASERSLRHRRAAHRRQSFGVPPYGQPPGSIRWAGLQAGSAARNCGASRAESEKAKFAIPRERQTACLAEAVTSSRLARCGGRRLARDGEDQVEPAAGRGVRRPRALLLKRPRIAVRFSLISMARLSTPMMLNDPPAR